MAEELKDTNGESESPKRGRPTGKVKAKRQNYADDLKQLRARVEMATRILYKCSNSTELDKFTGANYQLVQIAIETLEQE